MKKILLFGAGKSAGVLADYLADQSALNHWEFTIADANLQAARSRAGHSPHTHAVQINVDIERERKALVEEADIVISLLPPTLHYNIALDCIELKKNLLTASYIDDQIRKLEGEITKKKLFFLCEMGLDPGIDHMSAMQIIHKIKKEGGKIISFRSHTGGLVAPESDDNPWHYKISWNPRNVVRAGAAGALYKENGKIKKLEYPDLFEDCKEITVKGAGRFSWYPNRDSLGYIPLYGLAETQNFLRTTLRHPLFCKNWKFIVAAGLTDDKKELPSGRLSFRGWSAPILPFVTEQNKEMFSYLGLFDEDPVPSAAKTSADILQYLLESRLPMRTGDKDMIVMQHELEYLSKGQKSELKSTLIVKGENNVRTAMAKTVGLPLGIAAKLILQHKINITGLHIPILPEIYEPVLQELAQHQIIFSEEVS